MLSFSKGRPIAKMIDASGEKIIYLYDQDNENENKNILNKKGSCLTCKGNKKLDNSFYSEVTLKINSKAHMIPIPNLKTRESLYVAGKSGVGKSQYSRLYLMEYKKLFPKNDIFIFSRVEEDKAYDDLDPIRIKLTKNLIKDPINPEELKNSICVFDDIDTIPDKKIADAIKKLRNDILEVGRHFNVYIISTSHQLMDYKNTRILLNEATSVTFFPKSGSDFQINKFLKDHCSLNKDEIDEIMNLPSRWVTINKSYPMYILYDKGIYLLNQYDEDEGDE